MSVGSETREFPLAVVLSLMTSVLVCPFGEMHAAAEYLTGGPIWTHEFASRELVETMRRDILRQHPRLARVDASGVNENNWQAWLGKQHTLHPAALALEPIPDYGRTKSPLETLAEIAPGKPVVVVSEPTP